jgi:SRSO17 transposase
VQDPEVKPLTMGYWKDTLLKHPREWRRIRLPRAGGACAQAISVRVKASQRGNRWRQPGAERRLLIEELAGGAFKDHLSNLPAGTTLEKLVRIARQRRAVEQGCQQLKEALGLDPFEGRSWRGLHHHMAYCFMAYCFLSEIRTSKKNARRCLRCAVG